MNLDDALKLIALLVAAEPAVVSYIKTLLESAQGKTGDQFLADADSVWAKIKANAAAELPPKV